LGALNDAAELEAALGDKALAGRYQTRAAHIRKGIYDRCWDQGRGLLADNPSRNIFSQQTNALGVLYDVIPKPDQRDVLTKITAIQPGASTDDMLAASYYFRFYLARALEHAGQGDAYLSSLQPWRDLLGLHFSTWPETPGDSRSDSHAWSAHPIYDLLSIVAGIEPASPGFRTVRIAPHPGELKRIETTYPHPNGNITVAFECGANGIKGTVTLPPGLTGSFEFRGKKLPLSPGKHVVLAR
jgi:alpha-L-rhamnosidase